jgi:DNA-3-methyladenine glycosylase I
LHYADFALEAYRMSTKQTRCLWSQGDPLMQKYHDEEWGVPDFDSPSLWETLMLEGFQAGLSWITVLRKRDAFRKAFRKFDPGAKIEATIHGARVYLDMQAAGLEFSDFAWQFVQGKPIQNSGPVQATTPLSIAISKELKRRGFKFVGPTIVYAWMQAVGLVNDHAENCFRRKAIIATARKPRR